MPACDVVVRLFSLVISIISSRLGSGNRPVMALASRVLPVPGGPDNKILWPPAAATSMARLAAACPWMWLNRPDSRS